MIAARRQRRRVPLTGAVVASASLVAQITLLVTLPGGSAYAAPGSLDPSFGSGGAVVSPPPGGLLPAAGTGVAVLPNGQIAASGGNNGSSASGSKFQVTLFSAGGTPASGLWQVTPFAGGANAVAATPGGNIVAAGWASSTAAGACSASTPVVTEYTSAGAVVNGFPVQLACPSGATSAYFSAVSVEPDSSIVAAGTELVNGGGVRQTFVAWVPPHGTADTAAVIPQTITAQTDGLSVVAPLTGGDAYVAGDSGGVASVAAVTKAPGLDPGFGTSGIETLPPPQPGTADISASGVTMGAPGTILVDGITSSGSSTGGFLAELNSSTGAPVSSFGSGGTATTPSPLAAVAYQPLDNIVDVAGTSGSGNASQMVLEQFDAALGSLNTSFGSGGVSTTGFAGPASAAAVATQPDGKVVAAGGAPAATAGNTSLALIRVLGPQIGPAPRFAAFQSNAGALVSLGPQGWIQWGAGMAPGTSPSMIAMPNGGYDIAFEAAGGALWTVGSPGWINWGVGMAPGTSPSMVALPGGGYEIAFQAYGGALWTVGTAGWINWGVGMAPGTSPSMVALPGGGYEIGFQAYGGALWSVGTAGWVNWGVGMASGTSPSLIALPGGGYEIGFQAYGGTLWSVGSAGWVDWGVGMASGTSPSVLALPQGGYEIGFQAYGGALWTVGTASWTDWGVGMASGTSPFMLGLSGGSFEIAFEAYGGALWTIGGAGWTDWRAVMASATSPVTI